MSPESARTVGQLLNLVGLGCLVTAQHGAFRARDRLERATRERPQPLRYTARGRVLLAIAVVCVVVGAACLGVGVVAG